MSTSLDDQSTRVPFQGVIGSSRLFAPALVADDHPQAGKWHFADDDIID